MKEIIIRYLEGSASPEEERQLSEFLHESTENAVYFKKVTREWEDHQNAMTAPDSGYMQLLDTIALKRRRGSSWGYASLIAASLAIFACLGYHWHESTAAYRDMQSVNVPLGSRSSLILPDGTKVWVNSGSTLTYPREFRKNKRKVSLQGEGYFEVEASPTRPFIVEAGDCRFTVKGTKFNINAYLEERKVSAVLMEGRLDFKSGSFEYTMSDGELVSVGADGVKHDIVDANQYHGWTESVIRFDKITLPELLRRVSRELDVRISLDTDMFDYREIKASFSRDYTVDRILNAISTFLPISYRLDDDGVWHITTKK